MALLSIQYLRGLAALMVVILHLAPQWERMGYIGYWPGWLASGVDIFFVISGFIMWQTSIRRPSAPPAFYYHRIVRVLPLYWLLTSVVIGIMLVAPQLLQSTRFDLGHALASYAFLPAMNPASGRIEPVLLPGWTLNYEMFFYVLFGLALLLPVRLRLAGVAAVLVPLAAFGALYPQDNVALRFYSDSIMLEFLAGMAIGAWYCRGPMLAARPTAWLILLAGWAAIIVLPTLANDWPRVIVAGLPACAIVVGALALEQAGGIGKHRLWRALGDASYSLYLSHPLVLSAVSQAWRKLGLGGSPAGKIAFSVIAVGAAVLCGLAIFHWLEKPLLRWMKNKYPAAPQALLGRADQV